MIPIIGIYVDLLLLIYEVNKGADGISD